MTGEATLRLARALTHLEFRSGQAIAEELGCTRAAVWKQVGQLRELGIGIEAESGKGYRLESPLELLDREAILLACEAAGQVPGNLQILDHTDSTHAALLRLPEADRHRTALMAERQVAGLGRRGRRWHSPFARNCYLSVGWRFECSLGELGCLPLVAAIAAGTSLQGAGLAAVRIKWPNDLLVHGRKLGGCLVEVSGEPNGPCLAAIGIGINVHMAGDDGAENIDQPWADVASYCPEVSRNALAGRLLAKLLAALEEFGESGFEPFRPRWESLDLLHGQPVELYREAGSVKGVARGVGPRGGLLLEQGSETVEWFAGEVTSSFPA